MSSPRHSVWECSNYTYPAVSRCYDGRDLVEMVRQARTLGFYTNLITSALMLTPRKAEHLKKAGLDHVQISLQAANAETSDLIAGTPSFQKKVAAARLVKALGFPLTLNIVLHRRNIEQIGSIVG